MNSLRKLTLLSEYIQESKLFTDGIITILVDYEMEELQIKMTDFYSGNAAYPDDFAPVDMKIIAMANSLGFRNMYVDHTNQVLIFHA